MCMRACYFGGYMHHGSSFSNSSTVPIWTTAVVQTLGTTCRQRCLTSSALATRRLLHIAHRRRGTSALLAQLGELCVTMQVSTLCRHKRCWHSCCPLVSLIHILPCNVLSLFVIKLVVCWEGLLSELVWCPFRGGIKYWWFCCWCYGYCLSV